MKFGKYLKNNREEEWQEHYLDYKEMKKLLLELCDDKALQARGLHRSDRGTVFLRSLWQEFQKIEKFMSDREKSIGNKVKLLGNSPDAAQIMNTCKEVEGSLAFIQLNQDGMRKILKKYDKKATATIGFEYYRNMTAPHFQGKTALMTHYKVTLLNYYSSQFGDPNDISNQSDQSESVFSLALEEQ
ncbi:hypothetical protein DFA_10167 [Cavenderia fasciculata]|uniref:SPX domain-containing protein n=1 Tax=Cavenderia fasciculata TaxID=261658 RepID=F4Q9G4_CACFS|nr:uncharacterized protein DFA_10167 [Cavenderia fasciculata]EGG15333.1 hypothetical protein DFA_10167 [Cavenderia fasciculata]|eukprot:XP_004352053.1 hypothetical protein DFA_10167 [Cavenderia fasciculata]